MLTKEIERRWLLSEIPKASSGCKILNIEQVYNPDNFKEAERVRRVNDGNTTSFFHCIKTPDGFGVSIEDESEISLKEYGKKRSDFILAGAEVIIKCRMVFKNELDLHDLTYEVDLFVKPAVISEMIIMEVELPDINISPVMSNDSSIIKEITGDSLFSNFKISTAPNETASKLIETLMRKVSELCIKKED